MDRLPLRIDVHCAAGSHGVVTTPGASRFYRSEGEETLQSVRISVGEQARFEWLPLEALYYSGCRAQNRVTLELSPSAEMIGWDVAALGLPHAQQPFVQGSVLQHLELQGQWLERGRIDALDKRLLDGPLGFAGHRAFATLFFVSGTAIERARREALLDAARAAIASHALSGTAGATAPGPRVIVVRVLAPVVEPALHLLRLVRRAWRPLAWNLAGHEPRGWVM